MHDGSESRGQGLRVICGEQARVIARLSGTGTEGATVRLYFELFEADPARQEDDVQVRLQPLFDFAESVTGQIGRAHVCTPVTNAHLVCRLLLEKKKTH